MKETNKDFDEFDKLLFKHFEKNKEIPSSTRYTIEHSLSNSKKNNNHIFNKIKKIISILVTLAFLSTGVVFAKDIIQYIKSYFTNTNEGIETAANNGYIQNVDNNFVECNGLSVKIDNIILDDKNLVISFIYKYTDEIIDSINISDILIKDEKDNILYYISDDYNSQYNNAKSGKKLTRTNSIENLGKGLYRESLLINTMDNVFPRNSKLIIEIQKAYLEKDTIEREIDGLWNFNIDLSEKFTNRENYHYIISNTKPLVDYTSDLTDTSLDIKLYFDTIIDTSFVLKEKNITLYDKDKNLYDTDNILAGNNLEEDKPYKSVIELHYNLTKYDDLNLIDSLELTIHITPTNIITLNLVLEKA